MSSSHGIIGGADGGPKPTGGFCGVCLLQCRLKLDGTMYRHGGKAKGKECLGSNLPPGRHPPIAGPVSQAPGLAAAAPSTPAPQADNAPPNIDSDFLLKRVRLIEHIPKAARNSCGTLLTSILRRIVRDPNDAAV